MRIDIDTNKSTVMCTYARKSGIQDLNVSGEIDTAFYEQKYT